MSDKSRSPTSPSRPILASESQETVTPVSHVFGLSEVSASLEMINMEVERKPDIVHCAQTSYFPGAAQVSEPVSTRECTRPSPDSPCRHKRYALQIMLEVEAGPGYFVPPEDDSYSEDFTLEVLNHAYPGCTGVYMDKVGHMVAFYG